MNKPRSAQIQPPIPLSGHAAAKWAELVANVTPESVADIAAYCLAYSRWLAAEEWLAEPGHTPIVTITDDKGNVKIHGPAPQLKVIEAALKEMERLHPKVYGRGRGRPAALHAL